MQIQPYLNFDGRADEALAFYKKALNAEVGMLMRFKDAPPGACPEGPSAHAEKVMHSELRVGQTVLMISDGRCTGATKFEGISLSLSLETDAEAERVFASLSDGGKVQMPMTQTFFATRFGMLADRFGVTWMVIVPKKM